MEPKITFGELIKQYQKERRPSEAMINQMGVVSRSLLSFHNHDNVLALERDTVFGWRDWLLEERHVSRATWNNYLRHLRTLFNWAMESEFLDKTPLKGVKTLPDYKQSNKVMAGEDIKTVVMFLMQRGHNIQPGWFWCCVIRMIYYTGMRRKQLVNLCWQDILFQSEEIHLKAVGSKTKREWLIPLPAVVRIDLENLRMMTEVVRGRPVESSEQVFNVTLFQCRYKGSEMNVGQVSSLFERLRKKTNIDVGAHRFRHTFATQAVTSGKYREVQAQLGHTSLSTTMSYVKPSVETMRSLTDTLEPI